jgi:HTH-type transcriptional regulator/antitoxin HigA
MEIKVIHTKEDYEAALVRLSYLMDLDPVLGTSESNELEVWATLIEQYEAIHYPQDLPDPIEAIKFFMEQKDLTQNDMIEYFGSKAKTSEVLNRKRPLSLSMMRKLVNGLGMPACIFLQDEKVNLAVDATDWFAFPLKDMLKKGYFSDFSGNLGLLKERAEETLKAFISSVPNGYGLKLALMKSTAHNSAIKEVNNYALWAWQVKVLQQCADQSVGKYIKTAFNESAMRQLVAFSFIDEGPTLAKSFLAKYGIHFVIEPHLEQTYLDGAAFLTPQGNPVVALTLRHDRLDNFWFTLLHELAHVHLHLNNADEVIVDSNLNPNDTNNIEKAANELAQRIIGIDDAEVADITQYIQVASLAKQHSISPSIVIGQVHRVQKNYTLFRRNLKKVKYLFE